MNCEVQIRLAAHTDIRDAYQWYENQSKGLGAEFLRMLDSAITSVSRRPKSSAVIYKEIRRHLLRRFPYGLFYLVDNKRIVVLALLHVRQNPSQWQKRS